MSEDVSTKLLSLNASDENLPTLDWHRPQTAFFLAWLLVFCLVTVTSGIWFHLRRNIQPIKARLPWLNGLANIVNLFLTGLLCLNRVLSATFPCDLDQYQGYLYLLLGVIYSIRLWVLHYRFQLTQEVANSQHLMKMGSMGRKRRSLGSNVLEKKTKENDRQLFKEEGKLNPIFWYSRHVWLISVQFLIIISIISIIIILILPTYTVLFYGVKDGGGASNSRCSGLSQRYQLILYGIFILIWWIFACKLSSAFDYFHIKEELKYTGYILLPFAIIWFLAANLIKNPSFPVSTLISALLLVIVQFMSTIYPLYLSIFQPVELNLEALRDVKSFRELLSHQEGFDSFRQFLEGEFAIENLLFFQAVEDFKELSTITLFHHQNPTPDDTGSKDPTAFKEGKLEKYGGRIARWGNRYCVVKKNFLLLYPAKASTEIEAQVELDMGVHIKLISLTSRPFCFEVAVPAQKKTRRKLFAVADEKERQSWIRALRFASPSTTEEGEKKEDVKINGLMTHQTVLFGVESQTYDRSTTSSPFIRTPSKSNSEVNLHIIHEEKKDKDHEKEKEKENQHHVLEMQPTRRAPRGRGQFLSPEKEEKSDANPPQPIYGDNWRIELVAYALEIYFCYVQPDAFAQVVLNEETVTACAQALGLKKTATPATANEEKELDEVVEASWSRASESSQNGLDFAHLMKLAVQVVNRVDVEKLPTIFDKAQEDIFSLMHGDSFRRYLHSHLYRDFVEYQDRKRQERHALKVANLTD